MISHLQRCCLCLLICLSTFLSTIVDCAETGTSKAAEDDGFIGVGDDIAKAVATFDALAFGRNDSCGSGLFYCDKKQGGKCIPEKWRCDQDFDCLDKTDEPSDCPPHPCKDGQFTCRLTGHCLPMRFRCDQEPDCGITIEGRIDDSDEEASTCNVTLSCPVNYHSCQTVNQCVHLSLFCNGKFDCPDNSDEHKKCSE
uniref:Uncharacterized protein n=1 Tax=Plectus sambesii TaxID=2011161 RepID=A0A914XJG5_9BILA